MKSDNDSKRDNPWPHRLAVLLVCATFPLIWVGGLVTTTDAGMAVEDWPTTRGYQMLLFPIREWLFGSWDVFVEHGHRLLGTLAGMLTIALAVALWVCDKRTWLRVLSLVALALVIFQGVLGGLRVLGDDRQLARLHGCVGPAFFVMTVALAVFTSRLWKQPVVRYHSASRFIQQIALLTVAFAYVQLVIGAHVRHVSDDTSPSVFQTTVIFHLIMGLIVAAHVLWLAAMAVLSRHGLRCLSRPGWLLGVLILMQLVLGCATWVVKYAWPDWFAGYGFAARYTIAADSMGQTLIVTAHVATGSLILAVGAQLALRSLRLLSPHKENGNELLKGAAA